MSIAQPRTHSAKPVVGSIPTVGVLGIIGVTLWAMGFACVQRCNALAAKYILPVCDGLNMPRIHAPTVAAKMVAVQLSRYGFYNLFVRPAVRLHHLHFPGTNMKSAKPTIPQPAPLRCPFPAAILQTTYLTPEAKGKYTKGEGVEIYHAGLPPVWYRFTPSLYHKDA